MKKQIITASFALMCALVVAAPAKRGLYKTVKTANGRLVKVELRGDEFCHYWQAADGSRLVRNAKTGQFETADMADLSRRAAVRRGMAEQQRARRAPSRVTPGQEHIPYTGHKKGLIILVEFNDLPFKEAHTPALYNQIANGENFTNEMGFRGSVRDYFRDQSYGRFTLDFDIEGPVRMPESYAYYGENIDGGDDGMRLGQMVKDACMAVDGKVNFADYDWDGDGEVDQVFILYAGHGEASYDDPYTIWPHEWNLVSAMAQRDDNGNVVALGEPLAVDGVYVNTYACGCELGSGDNIDGIGTICHEFSHCLGLPDMYDTSGNNYYGMSMWDVMDQGSYNGDSFIPAAYTAYERTYAGWLKPTELDEDTRIDAMPCINDGNGTAYIIYNDGNRNEYYMLENRQKTGWDAALPGSGLLITHVDFNGLVWANNMVNSTSRQRCTVILADNVNKGQYTSIEAYYGDLAGDIYPTAYNNTLSNTSSPAAELNNANEDGSYYMNKSVSGITKNEDGTISFVFENFNNTPEDYEVPENHVFYESFDNCKGRGGNDGDFGVNTSGVVSYDNTGWSSPNARPADQCVRLGSTTSGQITSPEITLNGEYTLMMKAAPYEGDGTILRVEVVSGEATLGKTQFVMHGNRWSAFSTTLSANGPVRLRFMTDSGMFYLDEVCIAALDPSGIDSVLARPDTTTKATDNRIYTIDGRYVGTDVSRLPKGLYISGGKKFVKK